MANEHETAETQAQQPWQPPSAREARANAKAEKARAKALRPWYKKKRFLIPLGLVLVLVIVAVAGGGGDEDEGSETPAAARDDNATAGAGDDGASPDAEEQTDTRNLSLYPERPDRQDEDHEAEVGQGVRLSGYTASVTGAEISTEEFLGEQLTVFVTVENRDDSAQPYNLFDWRIQTENGQVLDPTINFRDDDLGSGDLVSGGTVSGTVAFDVGPGTYYVIYKPDAFDAARGIWRVTVS